MILGTRGRARPPDGLTCYPIVPQRPGTPNRSARARRPRRRSRSMRATCAGVSPARARVRRAPSARAAVDASAMAASVRRRRSTKAERRSSRRRRAWSARSSSIRSTRTGSVRGRGTVLRLGGAGDVVAVEDGPDRPGGAGEPDAGERDGHRLTGGDDDAQLTEREDGGPRVADGAAYGLDEVGVEDEVARGEAHGPTR